MAVDLLSLKLDGWPGWLRLVMFGTLACWMLTYAYLVNFPRKPPPSGLELAELAQVTRNVPDGALVFVTNLINNTDKTIAVQKVELEYYKDQRVTGGFQSDSRVSATYRVARDEKGLFVDAGDAAVTDVTAELSQPYAGQPYQRVVVPLAEAVEKGKSTRFFLMLDDRSLVNPEVRKVGFIFTFSNKSTIAGEVRVAP